MKTKINNFQSNNHTKTVKSILIIFIVLAHILISISVFAQNVGIGSESFTPHESAMFEVKATDKGMLVPRVDIADLSTAAPVTNPAVSLLVYNTNETTGVGFYYWNGTEWKKLITVDDAAHVDGSETIVTEGNNISITGTGTNADPYVINATGSTPTPTLDFSITSNIDEVYLGANTNSSLTPIVINLTYLSGLGAPVGLSLSNVPTGITYNFTPSGGFPSFNTNLVFYASENVTIGTYTITINAIGGITTKTLDITLYIKEVKKVFVTSGSWNGCLGEMSGADAKCNNEASSLGLSGNFIAYLSSDSPLIHARDRVNEGLFVRVSDAAIIAVTKTQLTEGPSLLNSFGSGNIWTGSNANGTAANRYDFNCRRWDYCTTGSINGNTMGGNEGSASSTSGGTWNLSTTKRVCTTLNRLVCIQE